MFTEAEVQEMIQATEAGSLWAKSLKIGDSFMGARPEAESRYVNPRSQRLFVFSAMNVLETLRLCTDGHGVIAEVGPLVRGVGLIAE
jgi:hypothetical protein